MAGMFNAMMLASDVGQDHLAQVDREQHKQALPVASAAHELYVQAQDEGQGDADFSAVLEAVLNLYSGGAQDTSLEFFRVRQIKYVSRDVPFWTRD
eukprot:871099-Pelagomonas_calceolata.AAC.1